MAVENLSDMPLELKPLAPFLQRSQELKVKDPTMSYWCLYYAVQQGVHLKPRDKQSRDYLLKLMTPLETIRAERNNNVLTDEKQACPYIEDFALRVFDSADNEDRRGDATRGTAKKFLAAANFLELLKVFEENPNAPSTSADANSQSAFSQHKDKIRYAKWKAGDIAKAFREGRKPTPGPANGPDVIRRELEVAAIEPSFGPGPGPNAVDQARQFSRDSSSASSPVPGGSRNASVSPRRRNVMLPLTSVANGELGPRPMVSPPASATASGFGFPPSATSSLIRDAPPTAPATATTKPSAPPFGRSHSATTSMDATRPGLPPPPRDLMNVTTPVKAVVGPNGIHLGPGKPGVSPGTWSTAATPGGFEESVRKSGVGPTFIDQGSPSRVPEGAKRPMDDSVLPSRQYPPTPALALKAMQHGDDEEKRLPPVPRQESFASNATTAGGALSRTTSYKSQDSAPAKPTEEPEARPKRVRWTPSVVGGTSTVASNSPPHSPMSPLGTLPTLPESDSSSNEGVRFSGPPTEEKDANGRRAPKNPYAEYPTPAARATQLPPVKPSPPHSPRIGVTQPPSLPGSATSSLISANGAKRSPMPPPKNLPVDQAGTPRGSIINTPSQPPQTGSGLSVNPSAPSFPAVSAPVSPATSNVPKAVNNNAPQVPTRLRRASESATGSPMNGIQPLIKPFVPRFPAHPGHTNSADTSPAGSTLINTISTLGRPKSLTPTPTSSPPPGQKTSPPLPRKAISPPPPASLSAIRDLPNSVNGRSSPNNMTGRSSPLGRMPTPPVSYQPAAPARELPKSLPFRQISAAKKHSKFAASALEFDDLETARQELLAALAILNGEKVE